MYSDVFDRLHSNKLIRKVIHTNKVGIIIIKQLFIKIKFKVIQYNTVGAIEENIEMHTYLLSVRPG